MKFITDLQTLQKSINRLMFAIPQKSTISILEYIYFSLNGNKLKITSSDRDITLILNLDVNGLENGEILVPGRKLSDLLKSYSGNVDLEFETLQENYEIYIKIGKGKFHFKGLDAEEYKLIPELFNDQIVDFSNLDGEQTLIEGTKTIKIKTKDLVRLCDKTIDSVSKDNYKIAMSGVLFQFRENYINAVSTDSFRLVKATVNFDVPLRINDVDTIIPAKTIEFLRKLEDEETYISLIEDKDKIKSLRFDFGNTIFITKIIDEKFPPYEQVLPKENKLELIVDKNQLANKLKPLSVFINKNTNQVKLSITPTTLKLSVVDDESGNDASDELSCEFNADSFELAYNIKFLEEALSNIATDETNNNLVKFTFSEPFRPTLLLPIKVDEKYDLLMLIMPLRIQN